MAQDVIQFVDSIATSPTVRLDLNDGTTWRSTIDVQPPTLRRSQVTNAMSDGGYVSASAYDDRTVTVSSDLISTSQDLNAAQLQLLARELDRETNLIRYQPNGATSPVFFVTKRSDYDADDLYAALTVRKLAIPILAEPFACGLREAVSVGTVTNDPAAATRGCYFDVSSIKGDVAAPAVFSLSNSGYYYMTVLAARRRGVPTDLPAAVQCESMSASTETANPGSGPDAAMSGTGTNNFMRTTFAGSGSLDRLSYAPATNALRDAFTGTFRAFAVVRRSSAAGAIRASLTNGVSPEVATALTTSRVVLDLGILKRWSFRPTVRNTGAWTTYAVRDSGSSTIDWDCIHFMPADEAMCIVKQSNTGGSYTILDGELGQAYNTSSAADPGGGSATTDNSSLNAAMSGSVPELQPGITNRFLLLSYGDGSGVNLIAKGDTSTVNVYYYPRYLHVRPATT